MSTATATRTLGDELAERWRHTDRRESQGTSDNAVSDAIDVLRMAMVGDYWQSEDGNHPPMGNAWIEKLRAAADAAGQRAWDEHVVPAVVTALLELLPTAPPHLVAYPGSEQLRADLALIGGQR